MPDVYLTNLQNFCSLYVCIGQIILELFHRFLVTDLIGHSTYNFECTCMKHILKQCTCANWADRLMHQC